MHSTAKMQMSMASAETIPDFSTPALTYISQSPVLHDLYTTLIRSFLDRGLTRSALFHAERFFALTHAGNAGAWDGAWTLHGNAVGASATSPLVSGPSSLNATPSSGTTNAIQIPGTQPIHPPRTDSVHTSRHLYAISLLLLGQTYSALSLVNGPNSLVKVTASTGLIDQQKQQFCEGCLEIKSRCCVKLGRWRQAREALESVGLGNDGLMGGEYSKLDSTTLSSSDTNLPLPTLQCKAGTAALHGNMPHKAGQSFKEALNADPLIWEAWEGLCAVGDPPNINDIFPSRLLPTKCGPSRGHTITITHPHIPTTTNRNATMQTDDLPSSTSTGSTSNTGTSNTATSHTTTLTSHSTDKTSSIKPTATGIGFFTPDNSHPPTPDISRVVGGIGVGNLFHPLRHEARSLRMGPMITTESSFYTEPSPMHHQSTSQLQVPMTTTTATGATLATSRPLSSADESGPVAKRLRSQTDGGSGTTGTNTPNTTTAVNLKTRVGKDTNTAGSHLNVGNNVNGNNSITNPTTKKPRPRQALSYANAVPSGGRVSTTSSRSGSGSNSGSGGKVLPIAGQNQTRVVTRRSSRLNGAGLVSGGNAGPKTRRRPVVNILKTEEEEEEAAEEWTAAQEQQAQQNYEQSLAQYYIYTITRMFALASLHLSTFSSSLCLSTLSLLPVAHQSTPLSLSLIARAHYEVQDYRSSERAFKALRWKERYRVWDMEVYSSLLWQMGRGVELAFLAREMVDLAPGSGEAWIVVGNLFSVRKERERALGCFRRAGELAVKGNVKAYAYTLCGHESVDEDLASAIRYFERALKVDGGRHYNAWYGLGTCYLRMGKVRMAEYHFRRAVGVNGGSAVLLGCVGLAVERRGWVGGEKGEGGIEEALGWFERAVEVSEGRNALVRFRRAKIYIKLRRYQEAIEDLEYLKNVTPEESNVIFQLAKVYRLVGNVVKSAQMLAAARDVSPKSVGKIKRLVEVEMAS